MIMNPEDLFERLKKEAIRPIYFITGDDGYLRNAALDLILSRAVDPATKDFNLAIFQGGDASIERVIAQAISCPMLSDRQTVVVRNVEQLDDKSLKALGAYVENPAASTTLVLEGISVPAKSALAKALKQKGGIYEFRTLREPAIPRWIKSYVKRRGKTIDDEAAHLLMEAAGTDLQNLSNEIDKLALFAGERKTIGSGDVKTVVGASRQFNIFELQGALGTGDLNRALRMLNNMLCEGESPAGIIVMLSRYFSSVWKLALRKKERLSKTEKAKVAGVPAYFVDDYIAGAERFGEENLSCAFEQLMIADLCVKRGAVNVFLSLALPLEALFKPGLFRNGFAPLLNAELMN